MIRKYSFVLFIMGISAQYILALGETGYHPRPHPSEEVHVRRSVSKPEHMNSKPAKQLLPEPHVVYHRRNLTSPHESLGQHTQTEPVSFQKNELTKVKNAPQGQSSLAQGMVEASKGQQVIQGQKPAEKTFKGRLKELWQNRKQKGSIKAGGTLGTIPELNEERIELPNINERPVATHPIPKPSKPILSVKSAADEFNKLLPTSPKTHMEQEEKSARLKELGDYLNKHTGKK